MNAKHKHDQYQNGHQDPASTNGHRHHERSLFFGESQAKRKENEEKA
jgi:hypothetical protein